MKYHKIILSLLIFIILSLLVFLVLLVYPYKVIDVKNGHSLDVVPSAIKSGGTVGVVFDYCKYINIRSSVVKNMVVNDIVYTLAKDTTIRPIPTGCHKVVLNHIIPEGLNGIARIHIYASYQINPFRVINYEWKTKEFMIEASASPKVGDIK